MENLEKINRAVMKKKLIPLGIIAVCMALLYALLYFATRYSGGSDTQELRGLFNAFLTLCIVGVAVSFIPFLGGFHATIRGMSPQEQERLNADCVRGCRAGTAIACRDGVLYVGVTLQVMPYRDMIWIQKVNKKFISILGRNGVQCNINVAKYKLPLAQGKEVDADQFIAVLQQMVPWCYYGKSAEYKRMRRWKWQEMVQTVDSRREEILRSMKNAET